jgi:hypothetical protein
MGLRAAIFCMFISAVGCEGFRQHMVVPGLDVGADAGSFDTTTTAPDTGAGGNLDQSTSIVITDDGSRPPVDTKATDAVVVVPPDAPVPPLPPPDAGTSPPDAPPPPPPDVAPPPPPPVPDAATCTNACVLGSTKCGGAGIQECVLMGTCTGWGPETACPAPQTCTETVGSARCSCATGGCIVGSSICGPRGGIRTCVADGVCSAVGPEALCPAPQVCTQFGMTVRCDCSNSQCPTGAPPTCGPGGGVQTCVQMGACASLTETPCPAGSACTGGVCKTVCEPESDTSFCRRLGARSCGTASGTDNCEMSRTVAQCQTCSVTSCAADNFCSPVCRSNSFAVGSKVGDVSADDQQDLLLGASRKGDSILYLRRANCLADDFRLFIADRNGAGYNSLDITGQMNIMGLRRDQAFAPVSYLTLGPDGRTLIGVTGDGRRFVQATRSGLATTDFSAPIEGPFVAINNSIASTSAVLADPLLSGDGLGFYYHVINDPSVNGHYESSRNTTSAPFSAGVFLPSVVQGFNAVKGVSADRLMLLLMNTNSVPWSTTILTRKDVTHAYTNPNAPNDAPSIQGFRDVVLDDCSVIMGNFTTTNCLGEDIFLFNAL